MQGRINLKALLAYIWLGCISAAVSADPSFQDETLMGRSEKLSDAELDTQRGGSGTVNISDLNLNFANVNGNVADNVANGVFTGTTNFESSFNSAEGLFTIINNFGPNSLIQHIMIVDIDVSQ